MGHSIDLPQSPGHAFYDKVNSLPAASDFDRYVEGLYRPYYADGQGRDSILCATFRIATRHPSSFGQQLNGQQRHQMGHEEPQVRAFQGVGDKKLIGDQEAAPQE